jgi:serine/threonine protein kinase
MSTTIGHFEILSELSKSAIGAVYKANDPQSGQTIALKVIKLGAFGDAAADLEKALLAEAEGSKTLSSPNITPVFGAGEIEGQFCATMEYVQGNSIATMLARKEGFSIWDLLDIGRQVCGGLEHAHSAGVIHYNLEPAKIMCGWDGTVKILGFGVSSVGQFIQHVPGEISPFLHYMSPEQVRGEDLDSRSNIFSLGAMFYEMVTDRKAFDREDIEALRQSILDSTPVPPMHVNPKVHPLLSDLIMKALEKDPSKRYQRGRELLDDLEKCKESKPQAAKKVAEAAKVAPVPDKQKIAAQSKFFTPESAQPAAVRPTPPTATARPSVTRTPATPAQQKPAAPVSRPVAPAPVQNKPQAAFSAAAAAGATAIAHVTSPVPEIDSSDKFISSSVKATLDAAQQQSAYMSSAVAEPPEVETFVPDAPKIAVDPMMAEGGQSRGGGSSFSEISELPPLKEIYAAPDPPPQTQPSAPQSAPSETMFQGDLEKEEKPKIQPREVAQKAIKEIKGVPPRLMLYSIAGAVAVILIIGAALTFYVHSQNSDDDPGAARAKAAAEAAAQPASTPVAAENQPVAAPAQEPEQGTVDPVEPAPTDVRHTAAAASKKNAKKKAAPVVAAVVIPGQMVVDSTPQGAQVQIDGKSDASWVTPLNISSLQPGQHSIIVTKPGYTTDSRSVEVASGSKATIVIHLAQLMASLSVSSDPAAASVFVDGRDIGKVTPAQVSIDKGQHVVLVRKAGYIDETTTAQFVPGQTVSLSPTLRPLGNADNIKTVGKMKKLFGGNGGQPGQATLSIRTQPKGAQISINQHMLDKGSPVDVMLDPGNYVIDINLSGYAPIHRVVAADKSGKVVVDETLQRQ